MKLYRSFFLALSAFAFISGCGNGDTETFDVTLQKNDVTYRAVVEFQLDGSDGKGSFCDGYGCEESVDGKLIAASPAETALVFPVRYTRNGDVVRYGIAVKQSHDDAFPSTFCNVVPGQPSVAQCDDGSSLTWLPH